MLELPTVNELPAKLSEEEIRDAQRGGPRARRGARRGHPRPQLPAARAPGARRLRRRLARPLAPGRRHRRLGDRVLRRPLHGRDGLDPLSRQDRADRRPRRRLLARRLDQRRPAPRLEGRASRARWSSCTSTPRPRSRRRPTTAAPPPTPSRSSSTSGASTGPRPRSCSAPTCGSAPSSSARPGSRTTPSAAPASTSGTASATSTPGSGPTTSTTVRAEHPDAEFLIHPECGCSTQAMEYVASGDIEPEGVHMLSTGGHARLHRGAPRRRVHRRHRERDALPAPGGGAEGDADRGQPDGLLQVHEDDHAAEGPRLAARHEATRSRSRPRSPARAKLPIERMVAIG